MKRACLAILLACFLGTAGLGTAHAADEPSFARTQDVIYGRKFGMALTMDVFTPEKSPNGAAVVWVVSGGWFSAHEAIWLVDGVGEGIGRVRPTVADPVGNLGEETTAHARA